MNKDQDCGVSSAFQQILKGPSNRSEVRPLGFLEISGSPSISREGKNPGAEMHYNIDRVGSSPSEDVDLIGVGDKPRRAAAVAWRTPAGPAKERQQVHASARKGSTEGKEVVPGLAQRSQRTRGYRTDEVVRVPVRKHRPGAMIEPAGPIGTEARLSRKMRDCMENKLNQKQKEITLPQQDRARMIGSMSLGRKWSGLWRKADDREETKEKPDSHNGVLEKRHQPERQAKHRKSMMEWTLGSRYRLGGKRVTAAKRGLKLEDELHQGLDRHRQHMTQMHQSLVGNQTDARKRFRWKARIKRFRWRSMLGCLNGDASQRSRAGVVVPDHYPGDMTPHLVDTEPIDVLNQRTETLRVISSAAKVCIRGGDKITDNFFNRRSSNLDGGTFI